MANYRTQLAEDIKKRPVTLYLGAGVSIGSGLPTWEELVILMYYQKLGSQQGSSTLTQAYPDFLYAIAEWHLRRSKQQLDILARHVKLMHKSDGSAFMNSMRDALYAGVKGGFSRAHYQIDPKIIKANKTLATLVDIIDADLSGDHCLDAVVSYNYDDLLEQALKLRNPVAFKKTKPVWKIPARLRRGTIPIYHVHGFVPAVTDELGSKPDQIVFTEEQYHAAASNPYHWTSLIQIRQFTSTVGVMVGLSLSDGNMRRLLDAVKNQPAQAHIYALMQKPRWKPPEEVDYLSIAQSARGIQEKIEGPDAPPRLKPEKEVEKILMAVKDVFDDNHEQSFIDLGIRPIWYNDPAEIPQLLREAFAYP